MHSENSTNLNSLDNLQILILSATLLFCFNTSVVLVYFIRRRVRLGLEIKRVPADQLFRQEYKNYFMNLKTTVIITNLIILILFLELLENILLIQFVLTILVRELLPGSLVYYLNITFPYVNTLLFVSKFTYIPLLSLVMNFLWHVYRKYKFKYTMIRWTAYIVMRGLVVAIWMHLLDYMILLCIFLIFCFVFDFIQYVYYSKRFYSHLKSREKEIRLFYFDKEAYIYSRWIRIHFHVSNILVTNALFLFTLGCAITYIYYLVYLSISLFDPQGSNLEHVFHSLEGDVLFPILIVYKVLLNLNYLYIIIVVFYKYISGSIKLYNINKHIKPIVNVYHDSVYYRYT